MNIEGVLGLFPLVKIDTRLIGYYIDASGDVYSTKQYKKPRKLSGSKYGGQHYYTLATSRNRSTSEQGHQLLLRARLHADWKTEISHRQLIAETKETTAVPIDRPLVAEGISKNGYIIGQVQGEALVFGSKPKIHLTLDSAKTEVERLAQKSPGVQIVYLQIKGAAVAKGIHWV